MMPFSVLRIWGLGIFSWALLGVGIYLAVLAYDEFNRSEPPTVATNQGVASDAEEVVVLENRIDNDASDDWKRWALLAGAIACLGLSVGGSWPVSLFLGNAPQREVAEIQPTKSLTVERPDGTRLHVEVYGDSVRPTLLFTHGWSLDTSAWNYIKGDLAKRYRLVAWDLPGMGRSKGPTDGDYSLQKMAHDLDAVIRATAVRAPLILVGHSIGGMIQQTFCRLHPEHLGNTVQGLALVFTTYTNPLRTNVAASITTTLEPLLIVPLNYLTIALAPLAWLSNWQSYLNGSLHIVTRLASFSGKQSRRQLDHAARLAAGAWPAAVARGNLAMLEFNEERTLPLIEVPVLVLGGEDDRMTLRSASDYIERLLPNDRPARVDTGHLGHWELSERVVTLLSEFTDHVVSGGPAREMRPASSAVTSDQVRST